MDKNQSFFLLSFLIPSLRCSLSPLDETHPSLLYSALSFFLLGFNGDRCPGTSGATREELAVVNAVGFALDGVCQSAVGVLGVAGNVLAMAVLFRAKKMTSVFNRLLTCLLVIHTLYILNSLTLQVIYEF